VPYPKVKKVFLLRHEIAYLCEETYSFSKVDNVDTYRASGVIFHSEHEPLQLALAIGVIADPHIESFGFTLSNLLNVGTLEVAVKSYLFLSRELAHLR
jgi:hypothetical protein